MPPDRPRPPSVERLLAAVRRERPDRDRSRGAGRRGARGRRRRARAAGGRRRARRRRGAGDRGPRRLAAFADPLRSGLTPVLNATGVILHTNLGRAPWPAEAIEAAMRRGGRLLAARARPRRRAAAGRASAPRRTHLIALTGAEDALVTINNAAALALAVGLAGRARRRGVARRAGRDRRRRPDPRDRPAGRRAAGRGRDDEPDAGRRLRGAARRRARPRSCSASTRRTSRRPGSSRRPTRSRSRGVAHEHGAIVVDDLGSGALLDTARYGLAHEPMPARAPGGRRRPRDVQRRQAGRRAAGRADRRAGRPHRPDPARSAGPRDAPRQGHPGRPRGDARAVPGRAGDDPDPRLADDRGDHRRAAAFAPRASSRRCRRRCPTGSRSPR